MRDGWVRFVPCCALFLLTAQNQAGKNRCPLLLVANQHDQSLSLIDPRAAKQIATVPVDGVTGHEVAASPDGKTAYVPIYGDSAWAGRERMAEAHR